MLNTIDSKIINKLAEILDKKNQIATVKIKTLPNFELYPRKWRVKRNPPLKEKKLSKGKFLE